MESQNRNFNLMLHALKERYQSGTYYTHAGDVLVSLRPPDGHRKIADSKKLVKAYSHLVNSEGKYCHIYAFAKETYDKVISEQDEDSNNHCIILRGVSGSGKTEACKDLLNFFSFMYAHNESLQLKISKVHPVLEAFGNATTSSNKNASRFASTLTLYFAANQVVGLDVSQFLLDQWRVTDQGKEDSNFHIFYYTLAGQGVDLERNPYRIIKNAPSRHEMNELRMKHQEVLDAMKILGFSPQEQSNINLLLTMILNLGNLTFKRSKLGEVTLEEDSIKLLRSLADALGLDDEELEECLCSKKIIQSGEEVKKAYTRDEAEDFLDFLLRTTYNRLFSWIVNRINIILSPTSNSCDATSNESSRKQIRVMDFYGYESLKINSYEQLLINITEEILHFMFIENYSLLFEEEYTAEGIEWFPPDLPDNTKFMNIILTSGGLLDSIGNCLKQGESRGAKGFLSSLKSEWSGIIEPDAKMPDVFIINHYNNEKVSYDVRGWTDKNKSSLPNHILMVLKNSENPLLSLLFRAKLSSKGSFFLPVENKGGKPLANERRTCAMSQYKNSVTDSLRIFANSWTSSVCCMRPSHNNINNNNNDYDEEYVLKQFDGMGLKDVVFSYKVIHQLTLTYQDFLEKYSSLAPPKARSSSSSSSSSSTCKDLCNEILNSNISTKDWMLGKSRVFLKQCHLARLQKQVMDKMNHLQQLEAASKDSGLLYCQLAHHQQQQQRPPHQPEQSRRLEQQDSKPCNYKPPDGKAAPLQQRSPKPPTSESPRPVPRQNLPRIDAGVSSRKKDDKNKDIKKINKKTMRLLDSAKIQEQTIQQQQKQHHQQHKGDLSSDSDFETWIPNVKIIKFGEVGSKGASIRWFKTTQANQFLQNNGLYVDWFHGIIPRSKAEHLMMDKPIGCYLVRVAESRLGYSLSFKDRKKCRHYMIDELPVGYYKVVGERYTHETLLDLVEFYKKNKLSNWNGYLTTPCLQADGECDYGELLITYIEAQELVSKAQQGRLEPMTPSNTYFENHQSNNAKNNTTEVNNNNNDNNDGNNNNANVNNNNNANGNTTRNRLPRINTS